jgi:hypothetical protein
MTLWTTLGGPGRLKAVDRPITNRGLLCKVLPLSYKRVVPPLSSHTHQL